MKTCTQEKTKQTAGRDNKGRFVKGVSGNPSGRNDHTFVEELTAALENESKRQGYINFADVVAKRALQYETVLIAVLKKVCPDKVALSGEIKVGPILVAIPPERQADYENRIRNFAGIPQG